MPRARNLQRSAAPDARSASDKPAATLGGEHTEQMEGQPGESLVTTEFREENGATTVTMTILHESREIRDMVIQTGMSTGVARSYERLAELLAA